MTVRGVVLTVAALNLAYFGVEFSVALVIGSVSLFADSIDFLEDASVNLLIAIAFGWSARRRARVGMALSGVLLIPALATLWAVWNKLIAATPPAAVALSLTGVGALVINLSCALMLARYRSHGGSLTRAAFLSARNDVLANVAIIAAGFPYGVHPLGMAGPGGRSCDCCFECGRGAPGVADCTNGTLGGEVRQLR